MNIHDLGMFAARIVVNPFGNIDTLFTFLYLGPETIMPLASIIATILGAILIFWRFIFGSIKRFWRFIRHKGQESPIDENQDVSAVDGEEQKENI